MAGTIKVLLLAADKGGSRGLRLDRELRSARDAVRRGQGANELEIAAELAIRDDDLEDALLRHDPQIVHFAGHGYKGKGIFMDDGKLVPRDELVALFRTFSGVRVVVLNACETDEVAKALSTVVDYTVGMEMEIRDEAAIDFVKDFYAALAFGRGVPFAFEMARNSMQARHPGEQAIPHLLVRPGADARPLEGKPAPGEDDPNRQVATVEEVEAEMEAEIVNEASGLAGKGMSQEVGVTRSRFKGPLKVGNKLRK